MKSSNRITKTSGDTVESSVRLLSDKRFIPLLFVASCISLVFRFDWTASQGNAWAAFMLSLFMYSLVYWSSNEFLNFFDVRVKLKSAVLLIMSLVCTFPYHLVSLDQYFYYRSNPYQFKSDPDSSKRFVDGLISNNPDIGFPGKLFFFAVVVAAFTFLAFLSWRSKNDTLKIGLMVSSPIVTLQAWFNSSAGSSYSWLPTFEQPIANAYTYIVYKFSNGQAAVNADDFVHTSMISIFQDGTYENLMLFRRPLPYYLVSQFSYFVNSYYIWLFFNIFTWVISAVIFYSVSKRLQLSKPSRIVGLIGYSSAPLLLTFVAQTSTYLFTSIALSFNLFLLSKVFAMPVESSKRNRLLMFSTVLCFLTYVMEPWIAIVFLTFYFLNKKQAKNLFSIFFGALIVGVIYRTFLPVLLKLDVNKANEAIPANALKEAYLVVMSGNWAEVLTRITTGISGFISSLTMMLFVPIVCLIVLGFFAKMNSARSEKPGDPESLFYVKSTQNLFLIGLLLQVFWALGGNSWFGQFTHHLSLLIFPSFILFAIAIDEIEKHKRFLGTSLGLVAVAITIYASEPIISGMRQPMYQNFYGHSSSNL